LLLVAGVAHGQSPPQAPPYFAIQGARIVSVSGPVIEEGTVVIANGLIAAVGKDVPIPPEAWVINGKGLTVYPGLIDALTDLGLQSGEARQRATGQAQAPGAPQPRRQQARQQREGSEGPEDRPGTQPWLAAADELNTDDRRIENWRDAGFTTVVSAPRAGIFPGQASVINLAGERPGEMVVKTPAALPISLQPTGNLFSGYPRSLMGVIAYVKQVYYDAAQYGQAQAVYAAHPRGLERPAYDRTSAVVHQAVSEGWPVLIPANNSQEILRALDLAQKLRVRAVLYGGQQSYEVAGEIAAEKLPVLVSLKWPEADRDADPEADIPLRTLRFRDRAPSSAAALEKAGVKFAFYSDGISNPADLRKNVKKAIEAGLAPDAALRALSLSAAEIFGVADRLGSIEPGKIANLVVSDGDLFNDKTKLKMIFVDGAKYEVRERTPAWERQADEDRPGDSEEVQP